MHNAYICCEGKGTLAWRFPQWSPLLDPAASRKIIQLVLGRLACLKHVLKHASVITDCHVFFSCIGYLKAPFQLPWMAKYTIGCRTLYYKAVISGNLNSQYVAIGMKENHISIASAFLDGHDYKCLMAFVLSLLSSMGTQRSNSMSPMVLA